MRRRPPPRASSPWWMSCGVGRRRRGCSTSRRGWRPIRCDLLVGIGWCYVGNLSGFIADDRWYLVRNIANILGRLQSPEVAVHLERVIDHPEYRVRREVADALA